MYPILPVVEKPFFTLLPNHIRLGVPTIFPGNLPVPVTGLRAFERRPESLVE
jgi:hypothetical protein